MTQTITRAQQYEEGLRFLHAALDQLDQAEACMKDVQMESTLHAKGYRNPSLKTLTLDLISLCQEADSWECEDCGRQITDHSSEDEDCSWWKEKVR